MANHTSHVASSNSSGRSIRTMSSNCSPSSPSRIPCSVPPPPRPSPSTSPAPMFHVSSLLPPSHTTRRLSTPTSHGGSHKSPPPPEHGLGGLTLTSQIVAAAVAALLLIVLAAACACCSRSKKRRKATQQPHGGMMFYADSSGFKGNSSAYYYTSGARPQWQNQVGPSSSIKWHAPPPPPDVNSTGPHGGLPPPVPPPPLPMPAGIDTTAFSYEELAAATGDFSEANLLGQGGFGYVHRGVLPGGKEVAVKQLKAGSGQGEREFQAEVDTISRVHHRHLVSLVGYCIAGARRLLVYEFVPNQTLEHHLHGKGVPVMEWTTRLRIAVGAAKGLAYLHEDCNPRIIHRDIKSANILLDNNFEAMVADFGLAKLTNVNHTHVSTRVMGTFGYLAPEYASSGKLTEKSDVFSYGVMLLELLTGRRPGDRSSYGEDGLVDWARMALSRALANGNYDDLVDPRLGGDYDQTEAARVVASAAACVRHAARRRPKMSQIVKALQGDMPLEELNDGVRPGHSSMFSSSSGSGPEYGSGSYTAQMERIRRAALPSPEYSAEYPGSIPEFGHPSPASSADSGEQDDRRRRHGGRR
ncbi:proline-rich receptor-like protein kinase PERK4 [Phragmites australis]|uniref:proline-rich receptor-like protein kinase PERK4 n=1 Tax=Phragmites australis TaxID=29695 RepID=UPI002D797B99|nr:proline-rich receptor-like protein kinase PERK4 [Phragmites australis]